MDKTNYSCLILFEVILMTFSHRKICQVSSSHACSSFKTINCATAQRNKTVLSRIIILKINNNDCGLTSLLYHYLNCDKKSYIKNMNVISR